MGAVVGRAGAAKRSVHSDAVNEGYRATMAAYRRNSGTWYEEKAGRFLAVVVIGLVLAFFFIAFAFR